MSEWVFDGEPEPLTEEDLQAWKQGGFLHFISRGGSSHGPFMSLIVDRFGHPIKENVIELTPEWRVKWILPGVRLLYKVAEPPKEEHE